MEETGEDNVEQLKKLRNKYYEIIKDLKKNPDHIKNIDLEDMYKTLHREENKQFLYIIEKENDLFDKKICEISSNYSNYNREETLLIKKIKDRDIKFRLEEFINFKNELYSNYLYIEAFSKGIKVHKN